MARGKLLRTKIRERKALVKADLQGKKEWKERTSNIPYQLKNLFKEMVSRVDPLEMIAVGGLTIIIQPIIATSEEILSKIVEITEHGVSAIEGFKSIWQWMGLIPPDPDEVQLLTDNLTWVLSFVLAFIMVRHPDMVIGTLTGMTKLALGLLG